MTKRTKQALSDDAKMAKLDILAKNHKIKDETITALKEKYGPYAYDIVTDALMKPSELMQRIGHPPSSSRNVLNYFATNDLTSADIAKAVKKDEATVQSTLTNYNINAKEEQRTNQPETTDIHEKSAKAENNFNQRVDNTSSLSQDKEKQIKSWAKSIGLDGEKTIQKLTEKYGELAYDIMRDSMYKPSVIMRNMGEKAQGSSRKTIEYFIDNDLTAEQISKALKKPLEKVQTALPQNETQSKTQNETQNETPKAMNTPWNSDLDFSSSNDTTPIDSTNVTIIPQIEKIGRHNDLKSCALINGKPIVELPDSTQYSLYSVAHEREVAVTENPVGVKGFDGKKHYYGAMQHNPEGIKNLSLYALLNPDKYGDYANKVFNTESAGYKEALKEFQKAVKKDGKDAYGVGAAARTKLLKYLKPNYLTTFEQEGKTHSEQMLQLQRDGASNVTVAFYKLDSIVQELNKKGINPTDVNPAVWGMVISVGIARGNIGSMSKLFAGKNLNQINSPEMIQTIADNYRGVFHSKSELNAVKWAKDHVKEKHSVTTVRELSMMLGDEQMYEKYLTKVAQVQPKQNTETKQIAKTAWQQDSRTC